MKSNSSKRRGRCLPVIVALAMGAFHSLPAESRGTRSLLDLPMMEAEAPAARKVVSEEPFTRYLRLECNSTSTTCVARLPAIPKGEQWSVQFLSCKAEGAVGASLRYFFLMVTNTAVTRQIALHYFAPGYRSAEPPFYYVVSQPMVLTARAGNVLHFLANSVGSVFNVHCSMSALRQTLG